MQSYPFKVVQPQAQYQLRLPSYRSSYLDRFHPYGRHTPKFGHEANESRFYDEELDDAPTRTSFTLSIAGGDDDVSDNLNIIIPAMLGRRPEKRQLGLVELVIDFAFAMRRTFKARTRALEAKN